MSHMVKLTDIKTSIINKQNINIEHKERNGKSKSPK